MLSDQDNVNIVGPGIIQNFQAGVLNTGGQDDKISAVTFTQNQIGSFNTGSANTAIEDNLFFSNNIGVASHSSTGTTLTTNLFKANDLAGATFVNSAANVVSFNTIQGSVSGLFFDGQSSDNTVNANNILGNTGVDINNANGLPLNVNNNQFSDNNCNTSVPVGTGTTLTTNLFKANDLAGATFVNSAANVVSFNTIQGSVSGLFFDGQSSDNIVNANNILDNTGVDINNANGLPLNVNNNQFSDNNCNTSVPVGLCLGK
jgi:parallel beta-helix repeat protein